MNGTVETRAPRRSLVVLAGTGRACDRDAQALAGSLGAFGIEATYVGREQDASRIAAMAMDHAADAIEVCLAGRGGVHLLRQLLRELIQIGRRDVRIVVHRVD